MRFYFESLLDSGDNGETNYVRPNAQHDSRIRDSTDLHNMIKNREAAPCCIFEWKDGRE